MRNRLGMPAALLREGAEALTWPRELVYEAGLTTGAVKYRVTYRMDSWGASEDTVSGSN